MKLLAGLLLLAFPLLGYAFSRSAGQGGVLEYTGVGSLDEPVAAPDLPELVPLALPEPSFLESIGVSTMKSTRGERNNNPGNIRISANAWQGKTAGIDTAFETFVDARSGIRALAVNLRTYGSKYGLRSVRQLVSRYAPASENNTEAYIRAVASALGVGIDEALDLQDDGRLSALVAAIITHENGRNVYSMAEINAAVAAA